ncbi:hypothetical protein Leryth_018839 [Lithospermum erythrorhizon]|nr:hypothetical protein Leryth_018839 [Lithospermum erythrorhizon]
MGMVVVISLPFMILSIFLGFGCYFFGKYKGRRDVRINPQVFGVPVPPKGLSSTSQVTNVHPSSSSAHLKNADNSLNV